MDFSFTPEEERFREELRAFLAGQLPPDWADREFVGEIRPEERAELARFMNRALADKKWLAMAWPKEYGGLASPHIQQAIFTDETAYNRMPGGGGTGVSWVGPAIMQFGNEEQRKLYLPRIANGDDTWSALYTEPGSGSDLASLQTRAVRDGDEYVINGTKIFAAGAQEASMGWLAARTDPHAAKHRGISNLIVPMDAPGITVRPMESMDGGKTLNEVFFENVRVSTENLVGRENRGWYQVMTTLDFERSGVSAYSNARRNIERLVEAAKDEASLIKNNPAARYELADRWIELQVGYNVAYRVPQLQEQGLIPNHEASVSKLYGSELTQRVATTGMHLLGAASQLAPGSPYARLGGAFSQAYLEAVSATIAAGTSEVQRNIIAQRGLGLPRG
ncbi:MAG: acyl-CoA dehydrogenase family protein [Dehalococcoidia bacterium]|nr:acyl-CoA dehydrogenase family protein [Dehalococcoidia bacterium]